MTVAGAVVLFVKTSLIKVTLAGWLAVNPVMEPAGSQVAVQVKSPPVTSGTSVTLKVPVEQTGGGSALVRWGVGLTVMVKSEAGPSQPLAWG